MNHHTRQLLTQAAPPGGLPHLPPNVARALKLLRGLMLGDRDPTTVGWAVRRTWPDGGHEFVGWRADREAAQAFQASDDRYWRPGPIRPVHQLTPMSWAEFDYHGRLRLCTATDCTMAQRLASGGAW